MQNFAVIGVGGFVAPRNLAAIRDTGNRIVAACDSSDSVGILDQFSFDVKFFRETERFDRFLEKLKRGPQEKRVHYVSICSPNYICTTPTFVWHCASEQTQSAKSQSSSNRGTSMLCKELENETGKRVFTILRVDEKTLAGEGVGIDEACPSIELAHTIRESPLVASGTLHPMLQRGPRELKVSTPSLQKMIEQ